MVRKPSKQKIRKFWHFAKQGVKRIQVKVPNKSHDISVKEFMVRGATRSNAIDAKFLRMAIPVIWEKNQKVVKSGKNKGRVQKVNGVLHIDANITLSDLEPYLPEAVLGKVKLIFTGSDPLSHPDETELVERMLETAKALYEVLSNSSLSLNE